MKQSEYMFILNELFTNNIKAKEHIFNSYNYSDHRACDVIMQFKMEVRDIGLKLSNCHHANGIGNNNDYTIYLETRDEDGFVIKKEIAKFYYYYGIFGGCFVLLEDLATGNTLRAGHAS